MTFSCKLIKLKSQFDSCITFKNKNQGNIFLTFFFAFFEIRLIQRRIFSDVFWRHILLLLFFILNNYATVLPLFNLYIPHLNLYIPHLNLYIPHLNLYIPHLNLYIPHDACVGNWDRKLFYLLWCWPLFEHYYKLQEKCKKKLLAQFVV